MIQESGRFEFDENLDSFYNYKQYGEQQLQLEDGQFNKYGYVAYQSGRIWFLHFLSPLLRSVFSAYSLYKASHRHI